MKTELTLTALAAIAATAATTLPATPLPNDLMKLGALAIALIITLSYVFRVLIPGWQKSNDKLFEEQSESFKNALIVLSENQEKQREAFNNSVNGIREEMRQQREDFQSAIKDQQEQFRITLDKIASDNHSLWASERDRFNTSYKDLNTTIEKLSENVSNMSLALNK